MKKRLAHYFYTVWETLTRSLCSYDGWEMVIAQQTRMVQFRVALGFANHSLTSDNPTNVVAIMEIASMMD